MELHKIRLANLRILISQAGSQAALADTAGLAAAHVSQMMNGRRTMGERIARRIENKLSLRSGWMDETRDTVGEAGKDYEVRQKLPPREIAKAVEGLTVKYREDAETALKIARAINILLSTDLKKT